MNLRGYVPSVKVYPSLYVPEDDAAKGKGIFELIKEKRTTPCLLLKLRHLPHDS
jgi:hypothetical protein